MQKKDDVIIQIAHITETPGPVQSLAFYLENKTNNFYKIYHPLESTEIQNSVFVKNSEEILKRSKSKNYVINYLFNYVNDFFFSLKCLRKVKKPINLAVGMNCFDVLPLVLFRKKFTIEKVIFFNTDFSRKRFSNPILNMIYILIDRYCAKRADKICCNTQRTIEARKNEGIQAEKIIHTPNDVFPNQIGQIGEKSEFSKKLLFVGSISKDHGLSDVVENLSGFDLKLNIIGSGDYENEMKKAVEDLNLSSKVNFLGFKNHREVIKYLRYFSGFTIAPYADTGWTRFCDPVKVKESLACLVPVIMSDVPEVAGLIKNGKLGLVYEKKEELHNIFRKISAMTNEEYAGYVRRISELQKDFDLNEIYKKIYQ